MHYLLDLFVSQFFRTPPYPTTSFAGQTVIVTGANSGLGLETAKHIVRLGGAKVILACRSTARGEAAQKEIEDAVPDRVGTVEMWPLDLGSYESVQAFAERASKLDRLDAVVENAGISTNDFELAEDNESTITINVISTFLLALLLLPVLRRSAEKFNVTPRLTIVSSEVHFFTSLPEKEAPSILEKLNDKATASMRTRYFVSKLMEILYIRELASVMSAGGKATVVLNAANPGLCHSNLVKDKPFLVQMIMNVVARTSEVGSRTFVAAACMGPESHGKYVNNSAVDTISSWITTNEGVATQKRVWDEINAKLEKIKPGITKNI